MIFNKITDIPQEYQFIIQKLIDNGVITISGKGEFYLTYEMLQIILIMVRAGVL